MNHRYLDARVNTASQPELQLILLDGALRFGRQARELWDDRAQRIETDRLLMRTIDIVEQLVHSVAVGQTAESKRLEEEYAFAFRRLSSALFDHDAATLDAVLQLLAFERDTWRLVCEKVRHQSTPTPTSVPAPMLGNGQLPTAGFSFQA